MLCWSHIFGNSLAFQWSLRTTTKNCWQDKDNCELCKAIKPYTSQQDCSSSTYHKVRYKENAIGPNNFTEVICYNFTTNKSISYRKKQSHWEVHIPWLAIASGFCSKHWSQNTTFHNQNTFLVFSMRISTKTREQILWRIWNKLIVFRLLQTGGLAVPHRAVSPSQRISYVIGRWLAMPCRLARYWVAHGS